MFLQVVTSLWSFLLTPALHPPITTPSHNHILKLHNYLNTSTSGRTLHTSLFISRLAIGRVHYTVLVWWYIMICLPYNTLIEKSVNQWLPSLCIVLECLAFPYKPSLCYNKYTPHYNTNSTGIGSLLACCWWYKRGRFCHLYQPTSKLLIAITW